MLFDREYYRGLRTRHDKLTAASLAASWWLHPLGTGILLGVLVFYSGIV